jgi:hypothetical protein
MIGIFDESLSVFLHQRTNLHQLESIDKTLLLPKGLTLKLGKTWLTVVKFVSGQLRLSSWFYRRGRSSINRFEDVGDGRCVWGFAEGKEREESEGWLG